jgi:hypothetical protein
MTATSKLSQIAPAGANVNSNTRLVGYDSSGPTDYYWTLTELTTTFWASPTFTGTITFPDGLSTATSAGFTILSNSNSSQGPTIENTNAGTSATAQFTLSNGTNLASVFWTGVNYNNGVGTLGNTLGLFVEGPFQLVNYNLGIGHAYVNINSTIQGTCSVGTPFTVATLPAGQLTGSRAWVTDQNGAPTFLGTLTGGGSIVCPVFFNGSAWVAG